jgi:hypothetical protein
MGGALESVSEVIEISVSSSDHVAKELQLAAFSR